MKSMPQIKIAIVGCGAVTEYCHLPAALRSRFIEIFALVDSNIENAQALSRKYAINCIISSNLEDVIDKVDGILIATPNYTHYALGEVAVRRGIPVLIEKPFTTSTSEAMKLCELAKAKSTFISVGYYSRFLPCVKLTKELLGRNFFGKVIKFRCEYGSVGGWSSVSGYTIDRKKAGGGVLIVNGTHLLDRILYWFGNPVEFMYQDDSYGGTEANCKGLLFFENELGKFSGEFFFSKAMNLKNKFILDTERYVCEIRETRTDSITLYPKNDDRIMWELSLRSQTSNKHETNYFQVQLEEFVGNIRNSSGITVDGWSAIRTLRLVEELYKRRSTLAEPWIKYKRNIENG